MPRSGCVACNCSINCSSTSSVRMFGIVWVPAPSGTRCPHFSARQLLCWSEGGHGFCRKSFCLMWWGISVACVERSHIEGETRTWCLPLLGQGKHQSRLLKPSCLKQDSQMSDYWVKMAPIIFTVTLPLLVLFFILDPADPIAETDTHCLQKSIFVGHFDVVIYDSPFQDMIPLNPSGQETRQ